MKNITGAVGKMGNLAQPMIGILLMLLTAILSIVLGQAWLDALLSRRVRVPVKSSRTAAQGITAGDAE